MSLRPPDSGQFKLNVDAARNMDCYGIGGVFWDHHGQVQFSFALKLAPSLSPEHAETVAIQEGLRLVESFSIESDLQRDC